jgi:DNA-directed RNA polymerase specialized sigma24 family protein
VASTLAEAFAEAEGPELDRIVYSGAEVRRGPPDRALRAAFDGFDWQRLPGEARRLARRWRCDPSDAEDAIQEELATLMERRPRVFNQNPERWMKLLVRRASYRLLANRVEARPLSIASLEEVGGDGVLGAADPCVPSLLEVDEDAKYGPLPAPGESWTTLQVVAALQRFRDYHGRPPRSSECRPAHRLPCYSTIRRHFGSFDEAVLAAGMVPTSIGRRRRRWSPVEAARACYSFRRRHGIWPNWADLRRHPGVLPSNSTMIRCFGSTRPAEVQRVAEAILRHVDGLAAGPC